MEIVIDMSVEELVAFIQLEENDFIIHIQLEKEVDIDAQEIF